MFKPSFPPESCTITKRLYPAAFKFYPDYFDKIMGTSKVREFLESEKSIDLIVENYRINLDEFKDRRKPYLLY